MPEQFSAIEEWLLFGFDGVSFAVPNVDKLKINVTNELIPEGETTDEASMAKPCRMDSQGHQIYALDKELKIHPMDAASDKPRDVYVLFAGVDCAYGLLCEWVDSTRFDLADMPIYSIPQVMKNSQSPLSSLALRASAESSELPVFLARIEDLVDYLKQLSDP